MCGSLRRQLLTHHCSISHADALRHSVWMEDAVESVHRNLIAFLGEYSHSCLRTYFPRNLLPCTEIVSAWIIVDFTPMKS